MHFRLVQLDAAIQMELWQEAYKAVEDIHGLMNLSKKVFASYYDRMLTIYLVAFASVIFFHVPRYFSVRIKKRFNTLMF